MKKLLNFILIVLAFVFLIQTPMSVMAEVKCSAQNETSKKQDPNKNNPQNKNGNSSDTDDPKNMKNNNKGNSQNMKNNKDNSQNKNNTNSDKTQTKDIVETAKSDGRFKTLLSALDAADLTSQLKEDGPFTVFAPTDDAFSKLPAGTLDSLLKTENKNNLKDVLSYHVSKNTLNSKDIKELDGKEISMINEKNVIVTVKDDKIFLNSSVVIIADIYCRNGVIHVIDAVLIPQ